MPPKDERDAGDRSPGRWRHLRSRAADVAAHADDVENAFVSRTTLLAPSLS